MFDILCDTFLSFIKAKIQECLFSIISIYNCIKLNVIWFVLTSTNLSTFLKNTISVTFYEISQFMAVFYQSK